MKLNGKPSVLIVAKCLDQTKGVKSAWKFKCKGGEIWIPKSLCDVRPHVDGVPVEGVNLVKWFYNKSPEFFELVENSYK